MNEYKRKLSLGIIYGNVEHLITRFLASLSPLVDEVIMVRAIGNQKPDATRYLAEKFFDGHHIKYRFAEYKNKDGNDWPHVDNFAAARQMSFNLASNEWVMWADTDDIIDPTFIPLIRRALDAIPDKVGMIGMPYHVPEEGKVNPRERIVKKSLFRWKYPIHECLVPINGAEETGAVWLDRVYITHMPGKRSDGSAERNMRIIDTIPESERTLSTKFHAFHTMQGCDRKEEAAAYGIKIISDPANEWGAPERWSILLSLAGLSSDENTKRQFFLQCIASDPNRREAYGELALCELRRGNLDAMLGWTRAMLAQPPMEDWPWNAQRSYWGWQGIAVHAIALRVNGDYAQADTLQLNHFKKHGAKISLLHATRRPGEAIKAQLNWLAKAENPDAIEHIFAIDIDDEQSLNGLRLSRHVVVEAGGGPVRAWNAAAEASHGQVLIQLSDDWEPPMHWDKLILERIGNTSKPAVLQVSDGHRTDDLMCMAILTRARYIDQKGLFHPDFFSMFSDNWFSECAHRDGVVIQAKDLIFEHLHPVFGKAEMDEVYARSNADAHYKAGERHLQRLRDGAITSWDVEGWCNYRGFYTECAKAIPAGGSFVEIGSWMGQSIIHLAQRLQDLGKEDVKIYCVDTFKGEEGQTAHIPTIEAHGGSIRHVFVANIKAAGVDGMIEIVDGDSAESASRFADASLDGCYIDAAHDYVSVVKDIAAWHPKVKTGGIFSGHDYPWHEVSRAVDEWALETGHAIEQIGSVWLTES